MQASCLAFCHTREQKQLTKNQSRMNPISLLALGSNSLELKERSWNVHTGLFAILRLVDPSQFRGCLWPFQVFIYFLDCYKFVKWLAKVKQTNNHRNDK